MDPDSDRAFGGHTLFRRYVVLPGGRLESAGGRSGDLSPGDARHSLDRQPKRKLDSLKIAVAHLGLHSGQRDFSGYQSGTGKSCRRTRALSHSVSGELLVTLRKSKGTPY